MNMKCKYCDYENPKDAIVCECCGATLATQRSIEYYRKEARKKVKPKKEKKAKKEKRVRKAVTESEAVPRETVSEDSSARSSALTAVLICTLYLLMIAGAVVFFTLFYSDAVMNIDRGAEVVSVYDPESKTYYFLLDGKLLPGCVESDNKYIKVVSAKESGATVFSVTSSSDDPVVFPDGIYLVVSEYGMRTVDFTHGAYGADGFREVTFKFSGDERYLIALVYFGARPELYAYPLDSDEIIHVIDSNTYLFIDDTDGIYIRNENGISRYSLDLRAFAEISSSDSITEMYVDEERGYMRFVENDSTLCIYHIETGETVRVNANNLYSFEISPNGKTVAYTVTADGAFESYLYKDGITEFLAENILPESVSDDGRYIYAKSPEGDSVYSIVDADKGRKVSKLAEGAYIRCTSGNGRQALISTEDGEYLSVDGNFPISICGPYSNITPVSECKNGFKGGIFFIKGADTSYYCRLGSDYTFEVLLSCVDKTDHVMSDGKTVLFSDGNGYLYRVKEGSSSECELIGLFNTLGMVTPNGKGAYCYFGSLFYSKDGKMTVVGSDKVFTVGFLGSDYIFMERDPLDVLPEASEQPEDGENSVSSSTERTYSLYCARGAKKTLVMENVAKAEVVGEALYVYVLNENAVEGAPLYDVYGGKSVGSLTLLIAGVR